MNSLPFFRKRILKSAIALILCLGTNQQIDAQGGFYNTTPPPTTARPSVDLLRATF